MKRVLDNEINLFALAVFRVVRIPEEKNSIARLKYNVLYDILTDSYGPVVITINMLENAFRKELSK